LALSLQDRSQLRTKKQEEITNLSSKNVILHKQLSSSIVTNYALPRRHHRKYKCRWRGMALGFKDLFHPLTTWIFSSAIVTLHLSRLIAFQYYLDNLTIIVKIKYKSLRAQYTIAKKRKEKKRS
jgi:hypothetical protein